MSHHDHPVATWPVGADMLFERVRSVNYMVLATALSLMLSLKKLWFLARTDLGSYEWSWKKEFNFHPIYWLLYTDCAGEDAEISSFAQKSCNTPASNGFVWEILIISTWSLVEMIVVQMVNNPWRTKVWGLPALLFILWKIFDTSKLVFVYEDLGHEQQHAVGILARQVEEALLMICWCALLFLLAKILLGENFMTQRNGARIEYTRSLMTKSKSSHSPSRFQELADALRSHCRPQDVGVSAYAALQEQLKRERKEEELRADMASEVPERPQGLLKRIRATIIGLEHPKDRTPPRPKSLDRLPGLAYVSLTLSALGVCFFASVFVGSLSTVKVTGTEAVDTVEGFATGASQASVAMVGLVQETRGFVQENLVVQTQYAEQALHNLSQAAQSLQSLDLESLRQSMPSEAMAIETLLGLLGMLPPQGNASGIANDSSPAGGLVLESPLALLQSFVGGVRLGAEALDANLEVADHTAQSVANSVESLNEHVFWATDFLGRLVVSAEIIGTISVFLALCVSAIVMEKTRRDWRKQADELRSGRMRQSPSWKRELYHPVKAPTLPGMMLSVVVTAFVLVFALLCLGALAVWVAAQYPEWIISQIGKPKDILSMLGGIGAMLVVKIFVLDKLASRFLTRNGFVVRWASFVWFVCYTLPFYALLSLLSSVFRFVTVTSVAILSMGSVQSTLMPPDKQGLDPAYVASQAMLLLSHNHNSPINFTFAQAFQGKKLGQPLKNTRAQRNWKLAVTLARNPSLMQYRVHQGGGQDQEEAHQPFNEPLVIDQDDQPMTFSEREALPDDCLVDAVERSVPSVLGGEPAAMFGGRAVPEVSMAGAPPRPQHEGPEDASPGAALGERAGPQGSEAEVPLRPRHEGSDVANLPPTSVPTSPAKARTRQWLSQRRKKGHGNKIPRA